LTRNCGSSHNRYGSHSIVYSMEKQKKNHFAGIQSSMEKYDTQDFLFVWAGPFPVIICYFIIKLIILVFAAQSNLFPESSSSSSSYFFYTCMLACVVLTPFYTDKINISAYGIAHAHKSSAELSKIIKEVIGVEKLGKINYKFFFLN